LHITDISWGRVNHPTEYFNVGDEVLGTVVKIADFGVCMRVADGVEGLAHVSEVEGDPKVGLDESLEAGDPVRARIIKIDSGDKKIGLSTRDVAPLSDEERAQLTGAPKEEQPAETAQTPETAETPETAVTPEPTPQS